MYEDQLKYLQNKLFQTAVEFAKKKPCNVCRTSKHWNVVPLYEHNPFLPSQIVFYCKKCKSNEPFFWEKDNSRAKMFGKELQKQLDKVIQENEIKEIIKEEEQKAEIKKTKKQGKKYAGYKIDSNNSKKKQKGRKKNLD